MTLRNVLLNGRCAQLSDIELVADALDGSGLPIPITDSNGSPVSIASVASAVTTKRVVTRSMNMVRGGGSGINQRGTQLAGYHLNSNGDDCTLTFYFDDELDVSEPATITLYLYATANNGGPNPLTIRGHKLVDGIDVDTATPVFTGTLTRNIGSAGVVGVENIEVTALEMAAIGQDSQLTVNLTRTGATGNFALSGATVTYTRLQLA